MKIEIDNNLADVLKFTSVLTTMAIIIVSVVTSAFYSYSKDSQHNSKLIQQAIQKYDKTEVVLVIREINNEGCTR